MSDSVQLYNFSGNAISNGEGGSGGGGGGSGGDTDGGSGGDTDGGSGGDTDGGDDNVDPTKCTTCVNLPYINESADVEFHEKFQFMDGANWVTSNVEAISEKEFVQNTSIVIANERFFFSTKYFFDGSTIVTTIDFEQDGEIKCSNTAEGNVYDDSD